MRVALLGDTHGNELWLYEATNVFAGAGLTTIIQVGDLGVMIGAAGRDMWDRVDERLARNGQTMLVAPGNHENYDVIDELEANADGWLVLRERILLAPRGHRTVMGGRSFVWLGGAASVDRRWRRKAAPVRGKTWWEQEVLTDADVAAVVADGHADIMVAHDAPHGVPTIEENMRRTRAAFAPEDLMYAHYSRSAFTTAFEAVKPDVLLHGHFHFPVDEPVDFDGFETRVFGLSKDGDPYSLGVLDLSSEPLRPDFL
ncbi:MULTISPECIES: metallophosphoesterase family protein [Demequina]|uniref:metallophosphoesterase family protein n=1 Tax=Demequina TaxID=577469 RepID=UPI000782020D|nr:MULTISPECIES: metallophosphoesterase [Demequina]